MPEAHYDYSKGERFGRVTRDLGKLGELRQQKKPPKTQVFYIWVDVTEKDSAEQVLALRSMKNSTNDQLTEAIRSAGLLIDTHKVPREDGEFVLDLLYQELNRRVERQPVLCEISTKPK